MLISATQEVDIQQFISNKFDKNSFWDQNGSTYCCLNFLQTDQIIQAKTKRLCKNMLLLAAGRYTSLY